MSEQPRRILGISFGVDTSAALLEDGAVVAAVLEERFTRIKHDRAWPARSLAFCLEQAGCSLVDVDAVAVFWNPALQLDYPHPGRAQTYRHHGDYLHMIPAHLLGALRPALGGAIDCPWTLQRFPLEGRPRPLDVYYVSHHLAHAASAFWPSPFEEAAVLTVDGYGERASTTMWAAGPDGLRRTFQQDFPHSLGAVYAAVTGHLGFRPNNGEGKVMGLAPYGDDRFVGAFRSLLGLDRAPSGGRLFEVDLDHFRFFLDAPGRVSARFVDAFGPPRAPDAPLTDHHRALAAGLQRATEELLCRLADEALRRAGSRNLCLAGGVCMNSAANGVLDRSPGVGALWVQPAAGDGGTAVGAALHVHHEVLGQPATAPRSRWLSDRFGPRFEASDIEPLLRQSGWTWSRPGPEPLDLVEELAAELAEGRLVGWFQGPSELGMRALGGRSILADPRREDIKDVLNAKVKFREAFRPFAPMVRSEDAADWFEGTTSAPFMQKVAPVRAARRAEVPGVVHVDGSARLQTVSAEADPLTHALLSAFARRTGVPIVVNTSFNVRGEPIVLTPADALRCFASTGLEVLALGPFLVRKA